MIESGNSRLLDMLNSPLKTVPGEGWVSVTEFADRAGVSPGRATAILLQEFRKGLVKRERVRTPETQRWCWYYYIPETKDGKRKR